MAREEMSDSEVVWFWLKRVGLAGAALAVVGLGGCPAYNVWSQKMDGEAVLAHAHSSRMVLVTQADAELEAAQKRAKAIEIVGAMAAQFPEYRQQEFIGAFAEALKEGKIQQIIYVPTEANIPLLEAGRHSIASEKK